MRSFSKNEAEVAQLAARSFAQNGNKEAGRDWPADQKEPGIQLTSASGSHDPCGVRGQIFAKVPNGSPTNLTVPVGVTFVQEKCLAESTTR